MDTILFNGNFYSLDEMYKNCTAVAIKNGIIIRMGNDEEILALAEKDTKVIDLEGKFVLPGFVDSHMHFLGIAQQADLVDLTETKSFAEAVELCLAQMEKLNDTKKWVLATGFNQDYWDIKTMPTRNDLDTISKEYPVVFRRACGHISICNTKGLEVLGILNERKNDTKFEMGFYADGTPSGFLYETTQGLYMNVQPEPSFEDLKRMIINCANYAASKGITEVHTDDFVFNLEDGGKSIMSMFKYLASTNELPIRIYQQCSLREDETLTEFLENGNCTGDNYGLYKIGPLKLMADGSLGAHTAWMRKPYLNEPETCGTGNMTDEKAYSLMKKAHDAGMQIAVHCIGDAALEQTLNMYRRIQQENPRPDCRHGIVHCQIMDEELQNRFKEDNILAYVQPIFLKSDMNIVDDCVGTKIAKQSYNWRRFCDMGIHQSGGSDCPVEPFDILPNLQYAVTRKNPDTGKEWYAENSVTLEEAIKMFTYEGAYASFSENLKGTLSVGKYADLVVLDNNLFEIDPDVIRDTAVLMTMVNGRIVYSAEKQQV